MDSVGQDVENIIWRNKHQLEFAECLDIIKKYEYKIEEYHKFGKIFYETTLVDRSTSYLNWVRCINSQYIHIDCMKPYGYCYVTSFCWRGKQFDYRKKNNFYCQCID